MTAGLPPNYQKGGGQDHLDEMTCMLYLERQLERTRALLDARGFVISPHIGEPGDYVIERAFVAH